MNFLKKALLFALILISMQLLLSPHPKTEFSLEAISSNLPFHSEWEIRALKLEESQQVELALSQAYHHLGNGGQCMTFVSSDGKFVIKFFKQKKFAIPSWMERFPIPFLIDGFRQKKGMKRQEKRNKVFSAFKLSFDNLAEETGLLYVHLNQTVHLKKILSVTDVDGNTYLLNLDQLEFVIQKKAELAHLYIDSLMKKQKHEEAREAIDQLLALQLTILRKGFHNRDPNFRHNYGFIDSQAILIDVGRIIPSEHSQKNLIISSHFRKYVADDHPDLLSHFDQSIAKLKYDHM